MPTPPQARRDAAAASTATLHRDVLDWYAVHARDLPWRRPDCSPWGVLVSEVMLQQTPVARVEPVWREWLARWPDPAALAAESPGEVVRAWGRLGYPRRALRLREAAVAMVERHTGEVPASEADLLALPGIGSYTAAAVRAFAFGERAVVVDTNVRRVHARVVAAEQFPTRAVTRAELDRAARLLPEQGTTAARWSVAVMELGALVCTARSPRCDACPVARRCAWRLAGYPPYDGPPRRGQAWEGTDRQVRGRIVDLLRHSPTPLSRNAFDAAGETLQVDRCLDSLVADGLVEPLPRARFRLPA